MVYSDLDLVWASNPLPAMLAPAMKRGRPRNEHSTPNAGAWAADLIVMDDNPNHVDKWTKCLPKPAQVQDMYLCTCLFLAAPTAASIALMEAWVAQMEAYSWKSVNQFAFNLAAARLPHRLVVGYLDRLAFPSGKVWNSKNAWVREQAREQRLIVHANYVSGATNKRAMLRDAGMWTSLGRVADGRSWWSRFSFLGRA